MSNGDLHVKARQRRCKGGRCISVHQNDVGLFKGKYVLHAVHDQRGNVKKRLTAFHYRKVVVRYNVKNIQDLLEHLSVLACHADNGIYPASGLEFFNQGTHFYCLGPCPENEHYFHQITYCFNIPQ